MGGRVLRLLGVYNAEGTLRGELAYFVGARLGLTHCALCDITHGMLHERRAWQQCRETLPIPFVTFHLDDQPDALRAVVQGHAPAVLAEVDDAGVSIVLLLGPEALQACHSSPEKLLQARYDALAQAQLVLG